MLLLVHSYIHLCTIYHYIFKQFISGPPGRQGHKFNRGVYIFDRFIFLFAKTFYYGNRAVNKPDYKLSFVYLQKSNRYIFSSIYQQKALKKCSYAVFS